MIKTLPKQNSGWTRKVTSVNKDANKLDKFFNSLKLAHVKRETAYWESLQTQSDFDVFKRWLFAILSVNSNWESNVYAYKFLLSDFSWMVSKETLDEKMPKAQVGLNERRATGIWQLVEGFREDPSQFTKKDDETWVECRNRLIGRIYGLGNAKTTYALNLSYPVDAELLCLDIHILRFMGYEKNSISSLKQYRQYEDTWLEKSEKAGVAPNVAREIYWNRVQGRTNSRYWSYCLEQY